MDQVASYLTEKWPDIAIAFAIAVGAFVLGNIVPPMSQRRRIAYLHHAEPLASVSDLHQGLKIAFNGAEIRSLFVYKLLFFNCGWRSIENSDVIPLEEFRMTFPAGVKVLSAMVVEETRPACEVCAQIESDTQATIKFSFLDRSDGAYLSVLCSGDLAVSQVRLGLKENPRALEDKAGKLSVSSRLPILTKGLFFAVFGALLVFLTRQEKGSDFALGAGGALLIILTIELLLFAWRRWRTGVPRQFREHIERFDAA